MGLHRVRHDWSDLATAAASRKDQLGDFFGQRYTIIAFFFLFNPDFVIHFRISRRIRKRNKQEGVDFTDLTPSLIFTNYQM